MLKAKISIQWNGRVYLTIWEDGRQMLFDRVASRAIAELRINALEQSRGEPVSVEIEEGL